MQNVEFCISKCDKFNLDKLKYKTISNRHEKLNTDIEVDFQFAYNVKNSFNNLHASIHLTYS